MNMYEDEYGIPLKLNHELKTMKEAEDYFKRLEKYVGDYKLKTIIQVRLMKKKKDLIILQITMLKK